MTNKPCLLSLFFLTLLSLTIGCAVADSPEGKGNRDTESGEIDTDSTSETADPFPSDSDEPPSSESASEKDSVSDSETESATEEDTATEYETETLPPEDTDWMEDTDIIQYWTFNGGDGDFLAELIDGVGNPWEWGIPDEEDEMGYPSSSDGRVWGTSLNDVHGSCQTAALTSKELDLSSHAGKTLSISWIHSIYYYYDSTSGGVYRAGFTIELFNGASWVTPAGAPTCEAEGCTCDTGWITEAFSMICNGQPRYLDGKPGFGGNSCAWEKRQVSVTWPSYPSNFKFRFVHGAASVDPKPGAYIDNVELRVN